MIQLGAEVTARPDGKARGGTVRKVYPNGDILFEYHAGGEHLVRVPEGKYQLSREWNDPQKRRV